MKDDELKMRQKVEELTLCDDKLAMLMNEFNLSFKVILFGGMVRDILFDKANEIRDVDIVLCPGESILYQQEQHLNQIIKNIGIKYEYNQFGGYKIKASRNDLDVWLLKDTWAFREHIIPARVDNLLKSVYLNIDAYAWNHSEGVFVSRCNIRHYEEIDIVLEKCNCEPLNLIRAVVLSDKYDMRLSQRIVKKLIKAIKEWEVLNMDEVQLAHYGKIMIEKSEMCKMLNLYCGEGWI